MLSECELAAVSEASNHNTLWSQALFFLIISRSVTEPSVYRHASYTKSAHVAQAEEGAVYLNGNIYLMKWDSAGLYSEASIGACPAVTYSVEDFWLIISLRLELKVAH